MPTNQSTYYYNNGQRVPLQVVPTAYAVRYRPGRRSSDPSLPVRAQRFLREDSRHRGFLPRYNLQIYQVTPQSDRMTESEDAAEKAVRAEVRFLNSTKAVAYATPAYRRNVESEQPMFVTNRFIVQLKEDVPPPAADGPLQELNAAYQVRTVRQLAFGDRLYLLEATTLNEELDVVAIANAYYESGIVRFAEPDFITERAWKGMTRLAPTSTQPISRPTSPPLSPSMPLDRSAPSVPTAGNERVSQSLRQWHLATAKVLDAWSMTRGHADINIAVLDDGVDIAHPEFTDKLTTEYDFDGLTADGTPKAATDNHGTACASVAVARGRRAYGAAPDCSLIAVRTPRWLATSDEAEMFRWTADSGADVISCSWGPPDNSGPFNLFDATRTAIHYCVTAGRGGKGIPVFFAAGNGDEAVSGDGYAANSEVMAIAASTNEETRAPYSDFGPEIWVCAPSNGGTKAIFTADRQDDSGYNPAQGGPADDDDYFEGFGGTSSAAPLVAGIAGLVLAANPELTVREVKAILRDTADRIGDNTSYDNQGHSTLYGYGRVNAHAAVTRAREMRNGGGGSSNGDSGTPSIRSRSDSIMRTGSPPRFDVNRAGRNLYAVEVATRAELFDASAPAHESARNDSNFYGSWQDTALLSMPTYTLPNAVWNRLKSADRLYYRAHFADDNDWSNYAVTTSDSHAAQAPSLRITAAGSSDGDRADEPSIRSRRERVERTGRAPRFDVDRAGRNLYAVEVTTRAALFDASAHEDERNQDNFYGSWEDTALLSAPTYTLPDVVWQWLKHADQLYYRAHFADDQDWSNYTVTIRDNEADRAPAIAITGAAPGPGDGSSQRTVTYPSGATFDVITEPEDAVDYSDPVADGVVPLIDIQGRRDEQLSANFKVSEFAATDGARYARISPDLIAQLQRLRERVGAGIVVNSGYRHPALNADVEGADRSQHMAGRAADIHSGAVTPQELARLALAEVGCDIGIGLGQNIIHIDLRERSASWAYDGAAMSEREFDRWVQERCRDREGSNRSRSEVTVRTAPAISGPESYPANAEPPRFRVEPGQNRFFAVEVATHWRLFDRDSSERERTPDTFYASWHDGMQEAAGFTIFQLPTDAWDHLRTAGRLYYRLLTASTPTRDWPNYQASTTDEEAGEAPWIRLTGERVEHLPFTTQPLTIETPGQATRAETKRWLRND